MIQQIIVWLIVGVLVGSFTGMLVRRRKQGFGAFANLGIGLVGALIGGSLFRLFRIDLGLSNLSINAEDLIAAFFGALILLAGLWLTRSIRKGG